MTINNSQLPTPASAKASAGLERRAFLKAGAAAAGGLLVGVYFPDIAGFTGQPAGSGNAEKLWYYRSYGCYHWLESEWRGPTGLYLVR